MIKKNINKILFYYSIALVGLLLATVNINNPMLLWILIGATSLLILKPVYIIPVYIISSLSSTYFIAGAGLGISRIIGFILILSGIIYIIRHPIGFNKKNLIYLFLLTIFFLLSSTFSLTTSLHSFILFMQYFAVVFIFSSFRNVDLAEITKLLTFSAVLTIIVLVFTLKENLMSIQMQRLTTDESVNENRFAMMLAQLSAIAFAAALIYKRNRLTQILLIAAILLAAFMIILSGSRSALVGILLAISLISIYLLGKQPKKFIIPFFIIVTLGFIFWEQIQQLDTPIINRFSVEGVKEAGGSQVRFTNWKTLIPVALENKPLFGYGFGAENVIALAKMYGLDKPAHNFLIDMFLQVGIIGVILFFSYFIFVAKRLKKYLSQPVILIPVLILLTATFNGVGETIFPEKLFWNGIALAWLYMNNLDYKCYASINQIKNEPV